MSERLLSAVLASIIGRVWEESAANARTIQGGHDWTRERKAFMAGGDLEKDCRNRRHE